MFLPIKLLKALILFCCNLVALQFPLSTVDSITYSSEYENTIETKFSTLQLSQYGYAKDKVVLAAFREQIAVAQRNTSRVEIFFLHKNQLVLNSSLDLKKILKIQKGAGIYILDLEYGPEGKIYISYLDFFDDPERCDYVKVVEFVNATTKPRFIFQSKPCLSMMNYSAQQGSYLASGRMSINRTTLYIAGGMVMIDLAHNVYPDPNIVGLTGSFKKDLASSNLFGSIAKIDLNSLLYSKISTGHRNPQGLAFASDTNTLWESEHGPSGGDELNLIRQGANYGWPYVSLGRPYNESDLLPEKNTFKTRYSSHSGYAAPVFSWVPSIAPSQLVVVPGSSDFDQSWSGNLLLSTLADLSIRRLLLSETNHVLYDERIEIGHRIRDLAITKSFLWLSTDDGKIILLRPKNNFNN